MFPSVSHYSFVPYGNFLDTIPGRVGQDMPCTVLNLESSTISQMFESSMPVYIQPTDRMSLLVIQDPSECPLPSPTHEVHVRFFLMDEPVCLDPGVFFNILPLSGHSRATLFTDSSSLFPHPLARPITIPRQETELKIDEVLCVYSRRRDINFIFSGENVLLPTLMVLQKGFIELNIDGIPCSFSESEMVLLRPGQYVSIFSPYGTGIYSVILMNMSCTDPNLLKTESYPLSEERLYQFNQALALLLSESLPDQQLGRAVLENLLRQTLCHQSGSTEKKLLENCKNIILLNQITQDIVTSPLQNQNVDSICKKFSVSRTKVQNLFQKYLQMSPGVLIARLKMRKAQELLLSNRFSVTQASELLGYSGVQAFSKAYQQHFGYSPNQSSQVASRIEEDRIKKMNQDC